MIASELSSTFLNTVIVAVPFAGTLSIASFSEPKTVLVPLYVTRYAASLNQVCFGVVLLISV